MPSNTSGSTLPPDQDQRLQALDAARSVLVQAPAGSGKTDLLTRRFLLLLGEVEEPGQIVAITFTKAAAAEMRHRILAELESATAAPDPADDDPESMLALARRALARSKALGWDLPELPAQLRISTIDSFCRDLAIQQPLLTGFGSDLQVAENARDLYRRAARSTLRRLEDAPEPLLRAIESLLLLRDNGWQELEKLLVDMLARRDRWMQDFVLERETDWDRLRAYLEHPFRNAAESPLERVHTLLAKAPGAREAAHALAQFACDQLGGTRFQALAELTEFPTEPSVDLVAAQAAYEDLADLLLTGHGTLRSKVDKQLGFPTTAPREKQAMMTLLAELGAVDEFVDALAAIRTLPATQYTDEEWAIVRGCFVLLRQAAGELRTVFADAGAVDFVEVAQMAQSVLTGPDNLPTDAAQGVADGIHHLLVDEFQDTSRRQYKLLASLAAAWPDPIGRSIFVVGDPMQSIYFFRDADAEIFAQVRDAGLVLSADEVFPFHPVALSANFRTEPDLVLALNNAFESIFAANDGSGIEFRKATPARVPAQAAAPGLELHLGFVPTASGSSGTTASAQARRTTVLGQREAARKAQLDEMVNLIRNHLPRIEQARVAGKKYRVAVLGRTRNSLRAVAEVLRKACIPFAAVELEPLDQRPEVLDALALAHALLNPMDRVAWLGVLRAPWCGIALADLHTLASGDDPALLERPISDLLIERLPLASEDARMSVVRLMSAIARTMRWQAHNPSVSLGTWLRQAWLNVGGDACVDSAARANLDLLWSSLDVFSTGHPGLLGPELAQAMEKLTALPDPEVSTDCGVQLMTIHKSKGLEFEVVLVPDLQAVGRQARTELLSWLERGLVDPDSPERVTEFLIAPLQPKGKDRGKAKFWVDREYRRRESQEMRRILYVAATRAREELHLFARPEYSTKDDVPQLATPRNSLLATAWPGLSAQIEAKFAEFCGSHRESALANGTVEDIAAAGDVLTMPSPAASIVLRRLPAEYSVTAAATEMESAPPVVGLDPDRLYQRHEGGTVSRALGSAVHLLLEHLAQLRTLLDWDEARAALANVQPRALALIRGIGIPAEEARRLSAQALETALEATREPHGQWILSPHTDAANEAAWSGVVQGALRSVRVDRVYRAGLSPLGEQPDAWWVIDYKTAHEEGLDATEALPRLRSLFAPQLQAYAAVLRQLHGGATPMRAGLYYPRMALFDWWEITD